jgi:hypothetical protein
MKVVKRPAVLCFICIHGFFFFGHCAVLGARAQQDCGAPVRLASSSYGSRYWIVARPLRGFSGTAFRTTGLARFVRRSRRPSATFSSAAPTAKRCGFACSGRQGSRYLTPSVELVLADWWIASRKRIQKLHRKGFDTLLLLVCWMLWNERNSRVFEGVSIEAVRLASLIRDEGRQWVAAGFGRLGDFIL